jgi:SNF2 family DNA or RNA helicase
MFQIGNGHSNPLWNNPNISSQPISPTSQINYNTINQPTEAIEITNREKEIVNELKNIINYKGKHRYSSYHQPYASSFFARYLFQCNEDIIPDIIMTIKNYLNESKPNSVRLNIEQIINSITIGCHLEKKPFPMTFLKKLVEVFPLFNSTEGVGNQSKTIIRYIIFGDFNGLINLLANADDDNKKKVQECLTKHAFQFGYKPLIEYLKNSKLMSFSMGVETESYTSKEWLVISNNTEQLEYVKKNHHKPLEIKGLTSKKWDPIDLCLKFDLQESFQFLLEILIESTSQNNSFMTAIAPYLMLGLKANKDWAIDFCLKKWFSNPSYEPGYFFLDHAIGYHLSLNNLKTLIRKLEKFTSTRNPNYSNKKEALQFGCEERPLDIVNYLIKKGDLIEHERGLYIKGDYEPEEFPRHDPYPEVPWNYYTYHRISKTGNALFLHAFLWSDLLTRYKPSILEYIIDIPAGSQTVKEPPLSLKIIAQAALRRRNHYNYSAWYKKFCTILKKEFNMKQPKRWLDEIIDQNLVNWDVVRETPNHDDRNFIESSANIPTNRYIDGVPELSFPPAQNQQHAVIHETHPSEGLASGTGNSPEIPDWDEIFKAFDEEDVSLNVPNNENITHSTPHTEIYVENHNNREVFTDAEVKKILTPLITDITKSWHQNPECNGILTSLIRQQKGHINFQMGLLSDEQIDIVLGPLVNFYKKPGNQQLKIQVLKQVLRFFGIHTTKETGDAFSRPIVNDMNFPDLWKNASTDKERSHLILCLGCYLNLISWPMGDLITISDFQAKELCQSLLNRRLQELRLYETKPANDFLNSQFNPIERLPCFLISPNGDKVRIDLFSSYCTHNKQFLRTILKGTSTARMYLERILGISLDVKSDEHSSYLNLNYEQFLRVVNRLADQTEPTCHILFREAILNWSPSPQTSPKEAFQEDEPMTENTPPSVDGESRKRKRKPDETPTTSDSQIDFTLPHVQKPIHPQDKSNPQRKGRSTYGHIEEKGNWEELTPNKRRKCEIDDPKEDLSLPSLTALSSLGNIELNIQDSGDFWKILLKQAATSIAQKVVPEIERRKVLSKEEPLDYPINEKFKAIPSSDVPIFNPGLKKYQADEIIDIMRLNEAGLSRITAHEMGLGKSFIIWELVSQAVAKNGPGWHLIITPKAVIDGLASKGDDALSQVLGKAWRQVVLTLKQEQRHRYYGKWFTGFYQQLSTIIRENDKSFHKQLLPHFLRTIHFFLENSTFQSKVKSEIYPILKRKALGCELHFPMSPLNSLNFDKRQVDYISYCILTCIKKLGNEKGKWVDILQKKSKQQTYTVNDLDEILNGINFPFGHGSENITLNILSLAGRFYQMAFNNLDKEVEGWSSETLNNVLDIFNHPIHRCETRKSFLSSLNSMEEKGVIITSPDALPKIKAQTSSGEQKMEALDPFKGKAWRSLSFDEAHRAKNRETDISKFLEVLIPHFKRVSPGCLCTFLTGTPIENRLSELWNLFSLLNEGISPSTLKALETLTQFVVQEIILRLYEETKPKLDENELALKFVQSFGHHYAFKGIVSQLLGRQTMNSPVVKECWNGRIPTPVIETPEVEVLPDSVPSLSSIDQKFSIELSKDRPCILNYAGNIFKILVHHSLENSCLDLKKITPEVQQLFSGLRKKETSQKIIDESTLLTFICKSIKQDQETGKKSLIVMVEHKLIANAIKLSLEAQLSETITVSYISGDTSSNSETIQSFKTDSSDEKSKVLIMTTKTGGVGIDLPKSEKLYLLGWPWTDAEEQQITRRHTRIGHSGPRYTVIPQFTIDGTKLKAQTHRNISKSCKESLSTFLLNPLQDMTVHLDEWAKVIQSEVGRTISKDFLSKCTIEEFEKKVEASKVIIDRLVKHFDLDFVTEFVEKVSLRKSSSSLMNVQSEEVDMIGQLGIQQFGNSCWLNCFLGLITASPALNAIFQLDQDEKPIYALSLEEKTAEHHALAEQIQLHLGKLIKLNRTPSSQSGQRVVLAKQVWQLLNQMSSCDTSSESYPVPGYRTQGDPMEVIHSLYRFLGKESLITIHQECSLRVNSITDLNSKIEDCELAIKLKDGKKLQEILDMKTGSLETLITEATNTLETWKGEDNGVELNPNGWVSKKPESGQTAFLTVNINLNWDFQNQLDTMMSMGLETNTPRLVRWKFNGLQHKAFAQNYYEKRTFVSLPPVIFVDLPQTQFGKSKIVTETIRLKNQQGVEKMYRLCATSAYGGGGDNGHHWFYEKVGNKWVVNNDGATKTAQSTEVLQRSRYFCYEEVNSIQEG